MNDWGHVLIRGLAMGIEPHNKQDRLAALLLRLGTMNVWSLCRCLKTLLPFLTMNCIVRKFTTF